MMNLMEIIFVHEEFIPKVGIRCKIVFLRNDLNAEITDITICNSDEEEKGKFRYVIYNIDKNSIYCSRKDNDDIIREKIKNYYTFEKLVEIYKNNEQ